MTLDKDEGLVGTKESVRDRRGADERSRKQIPTHTEEVKTAKILGTSFMDNPMQIPSS